MWIRWTGGVLAFLLLAAAAWPQEGEGTGEAALGDSAVSPEGAGRAAGEEARGPEAGQAQAEIDQTSYLSLHIQLLDAEDFLHQGYQIAPEDVHYLRKLNAKIKESLYPELATKSDLILFLAERKLEAQERSAGGELILEDWRREQRTTARRRTLRTLNRVSLGAAVGAGIASFGLSYGLWLLGLAQDQQYIGEPSLERAMQLYVSSRTSNILAYVLAGVGVLSFAVAVPLAAGQAPAD